MNHTFKICKVIIHIQGRPSLIKSATMLSDRSFLSRGCFAGYSPKGCNKQLVAKPCQLQASQHTTYAITILRGVHAHHTAKHGGKHAVRSYSNEDLISQIAAEVDGKQANSSPATLTFQAPGQLAPGTTLVDKYTILGVLGTGGSATTYQARTTDGTLVAVKALSLRSVREWKALTLFQREAQVLAALNHPGIPKYIDYFEVDAENDRSFYLVQEEASGKSLADMLRGGARCNTEEATRIARELLEILAYLSTLHPPVVHRDVKPENIVIGGGKWGGRVYLVDFGGVAGVAAAEDSTALASTIVGTYGYMAPEQFRGTAEAASDMYALGGTLLFLLSGQPPSAYPQERMRIAWRGRKDGGGPSFRPPSDMWASLLDGLLEPVAEDRLTAKQALDILEGKAAAPQQRQTVQTQRRPPSQSNTLAPPMTPTDARLMVANQLAAGRVTKQPAGSRIILERSPNRLDMTIPPKGFFSADTVMTGSFAIAWNAFVAFWTVGALAGGGVLFALFSVPFWFAGVQLGKQAFGSALIKERLAIGQNRFRLGQQLALLGKDGTPDFLEGQNEKFIQGQTEDLRGARLVTTMFVNGQPQTAIELIEGVKPPHRFGESIELEEQQWLVGQINAHLEGLRNAPIDPDSFPPVEIPKVIRDNEDDRFSQP